MLKFCYSKCEMSNSKDSPCIHFRYELLTQDHHVRAAILAKFELTKRKLTSSEIQHDLNTG